MRSLWKESQFRAGRQALHQPSASRLHSERASRADPHIAIWDPEKFRTNARFADSGRFFPAAELLANAANGLAIDDFAVAVSRPARSSLSIFAGGCLDPEALLPIDLSESNEKAEHQDLEAYTDRIGQIMPECLPHIGLLNPLRGRSID